jgi:negative regulator of sigma E activity
MDTSFCHMHARFSPHTHTHTHTHLTRQGGILHGVGRGYSDFTAALVSAALKADAMQVRVCARWGACVRACVRASVHVCLRACVSACVRACVSACVRACVSACVRACVSACVRACVRACASECVRAYVHVGG